MVFAVKPQTEIFAIGSFIYIFHLSINGLMLAVGS